MSHEPHQGDGQIRTEGTREKRGASACGSHVHRHRGQPEHQARRSPRRGTSTTKRPLRQHLTTQPSLCESITDVHLVVEPCVLTNARLVGTQECLQRLALT